MSEGVKDLSSALHNLPIHLSERARLRSSVRADLRGKRVLYWTHHALRVDENPALDVAIHLAHCLRLPLLVYQGLSENYRFASDRHHTFILEAAEDLQTAYANLGISFALHVERRNQRYPRLAQLALSSAVVITEDFPLEATKQWTEQLVASKSAAVVAVDTACVAPMRLIGKAYDRAFAYRNATVGLYRDRVDFAWPECNLSVQADSEIPFEPLQLGCQSLAHLVSQCDIDHSIGPVSDTRGGPTAGYKRWQAFRNSGLASYAKRRNQIEIDGVSRMSAYLHYGMVSPLRIAREASADGAEKFLDELLIWRELAYSFCFHREELELDSSLPAWAVATLRAHEADSRRVLSYESLARARSGSRLWDAAQRSLFKHGELHNNVRMTWGKAILAWSQDHHQALERMIDLNHRYALDGRDPASYGGILWCLGQFDRPFLPEQPIFGTVRPRSILDHEKRIDIVAYERRVDRAVANPLPRIAMIGTGLGGLMCSRVLQDHGLQVQCFDKSNRCGGRSATRQAGDGVQFDHGAQYFTIRDQHLKRYLDSWVAEGRVAPWHGQFVSIDEPHNFNELSPVQRYVGTPKMESLAQHLATDLGIQFETEVQGVARTANGYQLLAKDHRELGFYDLVLWNCPPAQTLKQIPPYCCWGEMLNNVTMVPCWAVMVALEQRWDLPLDGAFVNRGMLSWIARNSSKPSRPDRHDSWVLHSSADWARQNLETPPEQVVELLISEAERVTDCGMPKRLITKAHRWLFSRPLESLPDAFLWDDDNWLGACGDWCAGPRIECALKSGLSLAGRVLGALHEHSSTSIDATAPRQGQPQQLTLFDHR